jgi:hypothetical protein
MIKLVLCSTWILVRQTGSHALADTKSRVPCSTADLDLADSKRDRFRLKGIAPSAARQTTSLMSSFGFNTPSNNKSHVPPFTRRHVANVEKKSIHIDHQGLLQHDGKLTQIKGFRWSLYLRRWDPENASHVTC